MRESAPRRPRRGAVENRGSLLHSSGMTHRSARSGRELASFIDHTALAATVRAADVDRLCDEAHRFGFKTVCVASAWVERAANRLARLDSAARACTVVGFPLGSALPEVKVHETRAAIERGASEIDAVISLGRFLGGEDEAVLDELSAIVEAAGRAPVKVILETAYLDDAGIDRACDLAVAAGAAFVKTSTGFAPAGATVGSVARMRARVGPRFGVKASGGIRDTRSAFALLDAGASRLGTSASVAIVEGTESD